MRTPTRLVAVCCAVFFLTAHAAHAKTLRYASRDDPQTLDPHSANLQPTGRAVNQIYETLVFRDKNWKLIPWLATEWKLVDAKTWRFTLRQDVKFHDGTPMTADDVVFSAERALTPTSQMKIALQGVQKAVKVNDNTVDFVLGDPNPVLPSHMFQFRIMSKAWAIKNNVVKPPSYAEKEDAFSVRNTNGTGPFMLKAREADVKTVLVRNPNWWGIKAGHAVGNVEEVIMLPIGSNATRVSALVSGEVDFLIDPPVQDVARLKNDASLKVMEGPESRVRYIGLDVHRDELLYGNLRNKNPLKDVRVRRAIAHAIDLEAIRVKVLRGFGIPIGSIIPPLVQGYSKEADKIYPHDKAKAKQLLTEAGYPNGFEMTLDCANNSPAPEVCAAVAAMLSQVGITCKPNVTTMAAYFPKIEIHDSTAYVLSWGAALTNDALYTLQSLYHTKKQRGEGDFNLGRYSNPKVDALIAQIRSETDMTKRDGLIKQVLLIAHEELPIIPLQQDTIPWAMRKNVSAPHNPINTLYFFQVRMD